MTPEQRERLERPSDKFADDWPAKQNAIEAILAAFDAQSAELSDLRAMLALAARDDESGKAELGAMIERAACAGVALASAALWRAKAEEWGQRNHDEAADRSLARAELAEDILATIRSRGPALSLPDVSEAVKAERAACVKVLEDLGWPELAQRVEFREDKP